MHPLLFTFPCWNQSKLENSIEKYIAFILHYGIIIALAIIRAGRAVSEANKPLRGRVQPCGAISWPEAMV